MSDLLTNPNFVLGLSGLFIVAFLYLTSTVDRSPSGRFSLVVFLFVFTALTGQLLQWNAWALGFGPTGVAVAGFGWMWLFQNQVDPSEAVQAAAGSAQASAESAANAGGSATAAAGSATAAAGSATAADQSAQAAEAAVTEAQNAVQNMNQVFTLLNANCSTMEAHVADVVELLVVGNTITGWGTPRALTVAIDSASGKYQGGVVNSQEAGLLLAAAAIATNAGLTLPANYTIQQLLDALRS